MSAAARPLLKLNGWHDPALVAKIMRSRGRVHIPDLLDPAAAAAVHDCLVKRTPWQLAFRCRGEDRDMALPSPEAMSPELRAEWLQATEEGAVHGFSYRYANFRMFENYTAGQHREHCLMRFLEFLNSPPFLQFARTICDDDSIAFVDAQATLYRAGDFLTQHDDEAEGMHRRAAYVFNFTPDWRVEWGGLLAFPDADGHVAEAYRPVFNGLNVLKVPAAHCVTQVASFAPAGRYSITGWFRALPPQA